MNLASSGRPLPAATAKCSEFSLWPCPPLIVLVARSGVWILFAGLSVGEFKASAQPGTFAGNAQHTGLYDVPARPLNQLCWSTSVNLHNTGAYTHYGAPLITVSNTVLVPVRTTNGFEMSAFEGASGRRKYVLATDYVPPPARWGTVYQPVIATTASGPRLYYPGAGGTLYSVDNPDSDSLGIPSQNCFYTDLTTYHSNAPAYNQSVFINTALTADSNGVVFFGFRIPTNNSSVPPNLAGGGFARIDPDGNATFVLAAAAADDARIGRDAQNSAPALSNDGATLYVCVKSTNSDRYGYLLGLDTATLATKYRALLNSGAPDAAVVSDDSTASPVVGPDGDVFFGVLAANGRGYLLHFSADLQSQMPPSGFGWDNTPAIVPTNMVSGYSGTSPYLLFSKYNSYAGLGDGDGFNRIALLDPHAIQIDPHLSQKGLLEMREVLTVYGCTPDSEYLSPARPYAVREWCINAAAVNPATCSVFVSSEDGRFYRWNLALNSLTEVITLGLGLGEPYVPSVIGPDGTLYTLNGGTLFALGNSTNLAISLSSSAPDLCTVLAGTPLTFTAVVTNRDASCPPPAGTITFLDETYSGLKSVTNMLASAVMLTNGAATVTTVLTAQSNSLGCHYISAIYSGDTNLPPASVTLVQKVHAHPTTTSLMSTAPAFAAPVTITATVAASPADAGIPTGMVSFWDGSKFLAQVPLNTNGIATFSTTNLAGSGQAVSATYASDTLFAASTGHLVPIFPHLLAFGSPSNGAVQLLFSNIIGAPFTILGSQDVSQPLSNWTVLGPALEMFPGRFQFIDLQATNSAREFYRVRSP